MMYSCSSNKKSNMETKKFEFYTEYNQFYLSSVGKDFDTSKDDMESYQKDLDCRLGIEKGAVVIFTQSYGNIKGEIEVLKEASNKTDFHKYDHVVEGGIEVKSGELQLLDCPTSEIQLSFSLKPGKYRMRVYCSNFKSVKEPDLTHDSDDDYYRIEMWPSNDMKRKVLKQYKSYQ